ncbi:MAG: S9 family peptidase [Caldilineaceae bacterium]|nr:S9 family peptidase [Caldilineaceae bacterium]
MDTAEQGNTYQPSLRDLITLAVPVGIKVAPNGRYVAFTVRTTNWKEDCYETHCHLYDHTTGTTYPLHRHGSVEQLEWIDDQRLALLKRGPGAEQKAQIWLYEGLVGDGWLVTDHPTSIAWFKPFAGGLLYRATRPDAEAEKARAHRFGTYIHFEQEESKTALYYVGLAELRHYEAQLKAASEEEAATLVRPCVELSRCLPATLSIREVVPAPTGDALYLNCQRRDDLVYYRETSSYRLSLDVSKTLAAHIEREQTKQATKQSEPEASTTTAAQAVAGAPLGDLVQLPLPPGASIAAVAPTDNQLLVAHQGRDEKIYTRRDLWLVELATMLHAPDAATWLAAAQNLSASLDRDVMEPLWTAHGIFGAYVDGTVIRVAHFAEDSDATPLDLQGLYLTGSFHVAASGHLGFIGTNAETFPEVYLAEPTTREWVWQPQRLSDYGRAVVGWELGTVETIRWQSKDGTEIEGVLRKPANFDPTKQYPLVFVVHGGPRGFSEAYLLAAHERSYYPTVQFVNDEMLVLKPNYRGSTGRGQAFTELNVNNLGVGDLWDLESALDHLVALGWVDPARVGCMGWSQGGYIAAFAGLHSQRFQAVSVGAGISDWYTYHIANDIPYFTNDYLSGSPFRDRALYQRTAPMSNLAHAHTPMLIQHGADDQRVPLSNGLELYRGLQEMGVPVELFIYPGMAHPITKPRENHAVMYQNLAWFRHYLLGAPLALE